MYIKKKIYENFYVLTNTVELDNMFHTFLNKHTEFKSKSELNVYINSMVGSNTFMERLLDEKPISEYEMNTLAVVLNTTRENMEKHFEFYKALPTITNTKEEELYAVKEDSDDVKVDSTLTTKDTDTINTNKEIVDNVTNVDKETVEDTNTGKDTKSNECRFKVKVPKNVLSDYLYWVGKYMENYNNRDKGLFIKLSMDYFKSERA